MEIIEIILNWIGVLFLSIEAIKVENFKSLTEKLIKARIALNPHFIYEKENILIPAAPKGYTYLRKYLVIIFLFIGYLFIITFLLITKLLPFISEFIYNNILQFSDITFLRGVLNIIGIVFTFLLIPFMIGNEFISLFSKIADNYASLMVKLEKNTYNGVIGVIGFLFVTVSVIIHFLNR